MQLVDMKVGTTADDEMMLDWMGQAGFDFMVAATKADKLNKTQRDAAMKALGELVEGVDIIPYSSLSGEGKNEVLSRIGQALQNN
jgi:GTP-binding protein